MRCASVWPVFAILATFIPASARSQTALTPSDVQVHFRADAPNRYFPEVAQKAGIEGDAKALCAVGPDGSLQACRVTAESPQGCRFGEALVRMAGFMLIAPRAHDGSPTSGRNFELKTHFALPAQYRRAGSTGC